MSDVHSLFMGGGALDDGKDYQYVSKLNGDTFSPNYFTNIEGYIYSIVIYNGNLYISGQDKNVDGYLAMLDKNTNKFGNIKSDILKPDIIISAMTVLGDDLYLGNSNIGNVSVIKYNDKTKRFTVIINYEGIPSGDIPVINAMTVYNGNLYIGGYYKAYDDDENKTYFYQYVGILNNNKFDSITGLENDKGRNEQCNINAMTVYNKKLYVGGVYEGNKSYLAMLDKNKFSNINITQDFDVSNITTMMAYNGNLYIGGYGGVIKYNDQTKLFYKIKFNGASITIQAMTVYNNDLYSYSFTDSELIKLNSATTEFISTNIKGIPSYDEIFISAMIDYHPNILHADTSGHKVYKKSGKLLLILGLSIGVPVLILIIFLMYKYIPRSGG